MSRGTHHVQVAFTTLVGLVCSTSAPSLCAADVFQPRFQPTLDVSRTSEPIQVDGHLDDPGWTRAAVADGFAEVRPGDQVEPRVRSEAWVTYDDENLYVALIAHDDDPEAVRVSVTARDEIFNDDHFGILLDTYGDQSWGYQLLVNPLGIQADARIQSSGGEDTSFDLIWASNGRVTETGYQVEIAVPFASLRFPDQEQQTWRVNFWRDHQRDVQREYAWAAEDRDDPCVLCQWGTLTGIEGIQPGRKLDAIVGVIGSQAGTLADGNDPTSGLANADPTADASLSLKYGLSSDSSAELAVNPDFSQVESDAGQIDVNSTFALFFPERRPFFQEGSNLYDTWIDVLYTRSVNDPRVAGKVTGQAGKTEFLYLIAQDETSPLIIPHRERNDFLLLGESIVNIARVRQALRDDSYVGALVTDRRLEGGGAGTVISGDLMLRLHRNYRIEAQAVASRTAEPNDPKLTEGLEPVRFAGGKHTVAFDGETFWGRALYSKLARSSRTWAVEFDYWESDSKFRTDNGFTTFNDYRQASFWSGADLRTDGPFVIRVEPSVRMGRLWDHDNHFEDEWVRPNLRFTAVGQTYFGVDYVASRERFGGELFPGIGIWSTWFSTRPWETLRFGFDYNGGRGVFRDLENPELAREDNWHAFVELKPSERVTLDVNWDHAAMRSRERDEQLFSGWILRSRLNVNFTQEWLLRLIVQYNDFGERLDVEPLLTYRLNPFTVFFLGATNRHQYFRAEEFDVIEESTWESSDRQFFAKLQYLLQL